MQQYYRLPASISLEELAAIRLLCAFACLLLQMGERVAEHLRAGARSLHGKRFLVFGDLLGLKDRALRGAKEKHGHSVCGHDIL